ncbi:probable F-box protein At4g22030 [Carya illinoinensis]|nr:probable F-box protein At4g22030 [Carya illinoinensis]
MASLKASTLLLPSSSSSSSSSWSSYCCSMKLNAAIHASKLPKVRFSVPKIATRKLVDEMNTRVAVCTNRVPKENINVLTSTPTANDVESRNSNTLAATQLIYAILEAVADRVEMHTNVGQQRDNWNTLLLNSINMITLTAAAMVGAAAIGGSGMPLLALKLSATLLYAAASGMLLVMNKIQPSQLAEEQRNATRFFKQLRSQIQTMLALGTPTQEDVEDVMERVLALDKAYPLPLLGAMLDKFPAKFEPTAWWPSHQLIIQKGNESHEGKQLETNGWSEELEAEMREIMEVVESKDSEDYERLGNLVLKINKILAISGPLLTGIAAVGSACVGNVAWAAVVALNAGALATIVNTIQHGGQVGMVFEMYRNAGSFFRLLKETIEAALEEKYLERRENGELFETKVTLQLGRSLSQLRDLARKSASFRNDGTAMDEFASKLF